MLLKKLTLSIILLIISAVALQAKPFDPFQARKAAIAFYFERAAQYHQIQYKDVAILNENLVSHQGTALYYIFNISRGGWVLLSADDRLIPVIGYGFNGTFDPEQNGCCLKWWMKQIEKQIIEVTTNNLGPVEGAVERWSYLLSRDESNVNVSKEKDVEPLLLSTWDQGKYYNALCPVATGGPDGRALVGCVATSMSQVMFYYRWPVQGLGTHDGINLANYYYRWNEMLNALSNYNQGVAELCFHAGWTVDMSYGATGSGAQTSDVPGALESHFRYSTDCNYASKFAYTTTNWNNLLKGNLDAGHPLVYSGTDPDEGGHAWNCDGYQGTDYFHMNWGWSGYGNGYFYLNNLSVAGNVFSDWQGCVYNIYPPASSYPPGCTGSSTITYSFGTFEDGSGPENYENNSSCQWLIEPAENIAKLIISVNAINTESTNDVITIYDGDNTSAPVLATWSGTTIPTAVQSTGDKALVVFTTNGSTTGTGWQLEYKSTYPVYCSGITNLTAPSGTITDGSGTEDYSYNHTCRWYIKPPDVASITIDFTEFNVASDDWVNVYDGNTAALLNNYYGSSLPAQQTYNINNVLVYFKSNSVTNAGGWTLNYNSIPLGLDENGMPGFSVFPNPASSAVHFRITGEAGEHYTLGLYTIDGRQADFRDLGELPGVFDGELDVSLLSQGVYILRLSSGRGDVNTKLLID